MIRITLTLCIAVLSLLISGVGCQDNPDSRHQLESERAILVFSKTSGFRHNSIEAGVEAVKTVAGEFGVHVQATEDASFFTTDYLAGFDAVLFLNTTQTLFNRDQREAFEGYIRNGGGFAGVHAAADTEYDWPWYGALVGAWFNSHPPVQMAEVEVVDSEHRSTVMLPDLWEKEDEWYNFRELPGHVNVLLELNTASFEGTEHEGYHPIAWYHEYDGGRAFYTGMGHTIDSWSNPLFLEHIWGGLEYVMGSDTGAH